MSSGICQGDPLAVVCLVGEHIHRLRVEPDTLITHTWRSVSSAHQGQNGRHFTDAIFKCIFMNEKYCISLRISLKFVPRGPIDNNPALVQVMAWGLTGDKPLPEPMLTQFTDAYMRH